MNLMVYTCAAFVPRSSRYISIKSRGAEAELIFTVYPRPSPRPTPKAQIPQWLWPNVKGHNFIELRGTVSSTDNYGAEPVEVFSDPFDLIERIRSYVGKTLKEKTFYTGSTREGFQL
jgi:hypothetical protein